MKFSMLLKADWSLLENEEARNHAPPKHPRDPTSRLRVDPTTLIYSRSKPKESEGDES